MSDLSLNFISFESLITCQAIDIIILMILNDR